MNSNKQGKVWGQTTEVLSSDNFSVHYLDIISGGYCSEHFHKCKSNIFFVIAGTLEISKYTVVDGKETVDVTVLNPGEAMSVEPNITHKFKALTACRCLEVYTTKLCGEDIVRRTQGGVSGA
jgi:quercetin dioxygenase-like cupin family protein